MNNEFDNIITDITYCKANVVAYKSKLQHYVNAAKDDIRNNYYELYLYHKEYIRIYLNEVAEWEAKLQNYSQKLPII